MNKKIFLLIGAILAISHVVADKLAAEQTRDVTWIVDVTNCSPNRLYIGNPPETNLGGNCWHIPTNNDFYGWGPILAGESVRMSTLEILKSGAWMDDVCIVDKDINKYMETYIGNHKVKFQAEYHPRTNKNIWRVLVDAEKDGKEVDMTSPPLRPYVHLTYDMNKQITVEVGNQEKNMPADVYGFTCH